MKNMRISAELNDWQFDLVDLTETHMDDGEYVMIGKGQDKQERIGGGVAVMYRKDRNFRMERLELCKCAMSEDILAMRVECTGDWNMSERFVVIVVYITVEDERAGCENKTKCYF